MTAFSPRSKPPRAPRSRRRLLCPVHLVTAGLALFSLAAAPPARARVVAGDTLESAELPTLAGGTEPLTSRTAVNVILFWRPGQEHSLDTLKQMAQCEKVFAGKPVRMVGVVSGGYPREQVRAAVEAAGLRIPMLIDVGDELYGRLEIRQHPLVLVADGKGKVALVQPYLRLRYCDIVHAHVRYLLKEIDAAQLEAVLNPPRASFPSDDKNNVARRYVNMGRMQAEAGHCDKALASFEKALEISPTDKDALAGVDGCNPSKKRAASARP